MSIILVSAKIKNSMEKLTASEKKIARVILAEYPTAGLQPVAKLSAQASVSAPTVLRFVDKLGYQSYPDFQEQLLSELKERHKSALEQYNENNINPGDDQLLNHCVNIFQKGLQLSFSELPSSEFWKCVDLLCDNRKKISCIGGRYSSVLAQYLTIHLQEIRPNCHYLADTYQWAGHNIIDLNKKDILVVYDFRRYQKNTLKFVLNAASKGATIILITDRFLSPIAQHADCVLPIEITGPSPYDSYLPAVALTESLIAGVVGKLGEKAKTRIKQLEQFNSDFEAEE